MQPRDLIYTLEAFLILEDLISTGILTICLPRLPFCRRKYSQCLSTVRVSAVVDEAKVVRNQEQLYNLPNIPLGMCNVVECSVWLQYPDSLRGNAIP